jgi:hypothetical protein
MAPTVSALARPAVLASLFSLAAVALHPALHAERWLPGRELLLVALVLLALVGLIARALAAPREERTGAGLVAAGAVLVVIGIGGDGLLGRDGTLTLDIGHAGVNFEETGPDGRSLGLRPLGFKIGVEARTAAGVSLLLPQGTAELTSRHAVALGGFRLADPRLTATGGVARLRVLASDGRRIELTPEGPTAAGDLVLSIDQYFPDFALDENQRPFTRSLEPRNPAALLSVARGEAVHRAFVMQSMPGVHRVEPLGLSFSLLEVQPEEQVAIVVHRQPFAPAVLLGALLLLAGLALGVHDPSARPLATGEAGPLAAGDAGPLVAGAGLLACLFLVDSGRVLTWSAGLTSAGGRLPLPGAGAVLGIALIAALAGVLLLAAQRLAGGTQVGAAARAALWLALLAAIAGVSLALVRALSGGVGAPATLPLVGVACAALVLAAALRPPFGSRAPLVVPVVAALLVALCAGVGVWSTSTHGSYATALTAGAAATALLGLAACEATALAGLRRLALLVAALALLVRPS